MGSFSLRVSAAAGWIAFLGIVGGLIIIPTLIAGQPPTAATPTADAMAYFGHHDLVAINAVLSVFVGGLPIVPFGLGLRETFGGRADDRAAVLADIGLLLLIATLPVYVVSGAIGAALATAASGDVATFNVLHQLYQLLYNGAADVLEGAWIGAFSLAALSGSVPRWIGWLGITLAASRWIKAFVPLGSVPDAIISVSGLLFVAWFLVVVVALTMRVRGSTRAVAPTPSLVG
jgi:hypothetical protein